jgi:hypothetical protein
MFLLEQPTTKLNCLFYEDLLPYIADHSGRTVSRMNYLRPLEHWGRGFESLARHGCLFAFILCCPVQVAALQRADDPPKESYLLSI